ncbi:MAG: aminotransferase class V-fold PLP-dependent enzyme [Deltaproteobacteria bacterium]
MSARTYLDWNATAPLRPEARAAMLVAMDLVGNPSSVHAEGRLARGLVERARAQVAAAIGCKPQEVVFTSGATEAATVLEQFDAVEVDATAHDCVFSHEKPGFNAATALGVANNETGIIANGTATLLDIAQVVGRVPFAFNWVDARFAIVSGHKFGAPKGIGALIVKEGQDVTPWLKGGGQEMGRRSGTENITAIAGIGAAAEAAQRDLENGAWDKVADLRDRFEAMIGELAGDATVVGQGAKRLPNTSCIISPGWKGETQVMAMDLAGFAISAGSACSSGKVRPSRVLKAMGYDDDAAKSAIRVSIGPTTREDELMKFAEVWASARKRAMARAA